ncbi:hypothetical protein HK101_000936, partial [Irineochytrium annulatum]
TNSVDDALEAVTRTERRAGVYVMRADNKAYVGSTKRMGYRCHLEHRSVILVLARTYVEEEMDREMKEVGFGSDWAAGNDAKLGLNGLFPMLGKCSKEQLSEIGKKGKLTPTAKTWRALQGSIHFEARQTRVPLQLQRVPHYHPNKPDTGPGGTNEEEGDDDDEESYGSVEEEKEEPALASADEMEEAEEHADAVVGEDVLALSV